MATLEPQQRVGSFILLEKIGTGGMGEVWKARDRRLNRVVALKFIRNPNRQAARDLLREARAASALNHPNIITVLEIGESAESVYVATEFVEGETLRAHMDRSPVPFETALDVAIQVSLGLAAAHRNGIVHCDVKPENVMLRIDGYVKVVDFGLATALPWSSTTVNDSSDLSTTGALSGTFGYMSPEQARGKTMGPESDVFSFGIVLYELLTGQHPFRTDNPVDTLHQITSAEPPNIGKLRPDLPREVRDIVDRCLKKDPGQRFPSAAELETKLRLAGTAPPSKPRPRTRTAIAAFVLIVLMGLLLWIWNPEGLQLTTPGVIHSVAVMNFRSVPEDAFADVLTSGLSEDLGDALTREGFLVSSRSRVLALGTLADARRVGRELAVDAVLEGSVTMMDQNQVRIHVELVNAQTGFQIWSRSLLARSGDLLTTDFARAITRELKKDVAAINSVVDKGCCPAYSGGLKHEWTTR